MAQSDNSTPDNLIRMIQVLAEDEYLSQWFVSLRFMADGLRRSVISTMVEEMKANNEDPELVAALQTLMSPEVYAAAAEAMMNLRP
jgi:hypothetical protein